LRNYALFGQLHQTSTFPGTNSAYLEDDFLHFLVRRLELSDEDQHDFPGVVVGVLGVHQGDQVPDGLQERGQTLERWE